MPFVIPSVSTRDRVKAIFYSNVVRPHEELLEWLDEVIPEILSSISVERQQNFAVPKTPRQKAKTRTRAAQKPPLNLDDFKPISLRSMRYETRSRKKSSSVRKSKSVKLTNAKVSLICEALASLDDNDKTPIATKRRESPPLLIDLDRTLNDENEAVVMPAPKKIAKTKKAIAPEEEHENLLKSPDTETLTVGVENARKTRSTRADNDDIGQSKITRKTRSIRSKKDDDSARIIEIEEQHTVASAIFEPVVVAEKQVIRRESRKSTKENEHDQSKRPKIDQIDRPKSNDLFFDDGPKIQESIIDQSSTMYVMDFDANGTNLTPTNIKSPIVEEAEIQEQPSTSSNNLYDKIYQSSVVLSKITENIVVEKSPKSAAVPTSVDQILSSENHILNKVEKKESSSIRTFSKITPIATTKLQLLPPVTLLPSKSKKPSAKIVLTKSPVADVRTTRSKARQKVQNEDDNKDEGVMKPNQISNFKVSSVSSSSSSTLTTTSSGMKTPSTLTKTSKYFNKLINNSGLKNKTPNTSSNNLFNSLFSINSSKKLTSAAPLNMATGSVSSFIKRNTPVKITQKEAESQLLEKIKQQDAKQQEARDKKDEFLKNKAEENKRLREEREQKAAAKRKQLEEENKRKIEQKAASKVLETKNVQQQKSANQEAKRKLDEEREKLRIKKEMEDKLEAERKAQAAAAPSVKPKMAPIKIKEQEQPSSSNYEMTPTDVKRAKKPMKSKDNYGIDDLNSGDETDEAESPKKPIPAWAQGVCFKAALVNQAYSNIDPMSIFGLMNEKVDLEKIFNDKRKRYHVRTSSGIWPETSFFAFGVPADDDDKGEH